MIAQKNCSISTICITTPKFMNIFNRTLFSITKDYTYIIYGEMIANI